MENKELNAKQQRFVAEYLIDLDAKAAYQRAGYKATGKSAESAGPRLLSDVRIQQAIEEAKERRAERTAITQDYVLKTIQDTIERCSQAEPVLDKEGKETGEYTFNAAAVLKGTELLGRHLKMFTDKIDHSGAVSVVIQRFGKEPQQ